MAEPFDPLGQFHKRSEIRCARDLSFRYFTDLVFREPVRPDISYLLDAERKPAILRVYLQNLGLDGIALFEFFAGMLEALRPANVADVYQTFHALFYFEKSAKISKIENTAVYAYAYQIF